MHYPNLSFCFGVNKVKRANNKKCPKHIMFSNQALSYFLGINAYYSTSALMQAYYYHYMI